MRLKIDVSIIVCCYNSENRIVSTLAHISKQSVTNLCCELILVDNNSTDSTTDVAKQAWESFGNPFQLQIIKESKPGLSYARKAGVFAAQGEILVFCDDDNWLSEYFIMQGFEIMNSNHEIGVLGGRGIPVFEVEEPDWFSTFQGCYAVGFQAICSGDITSRGYVWGAGCFIRRQILLQLYESGFESFCSGRKEGLLLSGDDSEICKWHLLIGQKLWFDENLVFEHYIETSRLNKIYLEGLQRGFQLSDQFLSIYDELISYQKASLLQKIRIELISIIKLSTRFKIEINRRAIKRKIIKRIKKYQSLKNE